MKPSFEEAKIFFEERALPRRTRDRIAEDKYRAAHDKVKYFYRRVGNEESDRGELYPVLTAGFETFAHFGIGIGIYFSQLLFLVCVTFVGGMLMILADNSYTNKDYNRLDPNKASYIVTAACSSYVNVTATAGCSNNATSCIVRYTSDCDLPYGAAVADVTMSMFFAVAVFASAYFEFKIVEDLDEAVQTAADYSVEVKDPPHDADNPDEWQAFFSRFGIVRYISIVRGNNELLETVLKTHQHMQKANALQRAGSHNQRLTYYQQKAHHFHEELLHCCRQSYPVTRVYATFEHEEHQRLCLKEMEVPDIYAIFDIKDHSAARKAFRDNAVLNVVEPVEPDNILWENLEVPMFVKNFRRVLSFLLAIGLLSATWYLVDETQKVSPGLLAAVIGIVDSLLPAIFDALTELSMPTSEGWRQSVLQLRLFLARLLLSTVLPYVQTQWNNVLDPSFIKQIMTVQIAACLTAPVIAVFDPAGLVSKFILARFSMTQEEMNLKWSGTKWSLAEKYTGIAKVVFVSMYYCLLIPYSLFLCVPTFLFIFCVDRYLLLRKWREMPMLDQKIAVRLRQQAILAVAAHMYASMRFIYSWPMDEAYEHDGYYEKVDKYPIFSVWGLNLQDWQSPGQKRIFYAYKICLFLTAFVAFTAWVVIPGVKYLQRLFCYKLDLVGSSQGISFSQVEKMKVYEPMIQTDDRNYLCCHTIGVLEKHRPSVLVPGPSDPVDLSFYVPAQHRPFVLSIVKYYSQNTTVPFQKTAKENVVLRMGELTQMTNIVSAGDLDTQLDENDLPEVQYFPVSRPADLPPPPPLPDDLFNKIKGKVVSRESPEEDTAKKTAVQRVAMLRTQQQAVSRFREGTRGTGRIMPTSSEAPLPPPKRTYNRRYEKRLPMDDDDYNDYDVV